jgi:hypothetical protein
MSAEQCIDGRLTDKNTCFIVKSKYQLASDFTVKDESGNDWYKLGDKATTMRNKMVLKNMEGEKVCVVQKKLLNVRTNFQIFRYKPNQAGQESTETDDGVPIYRFAIVEQRSGGKKPSFSYYLYKGNEEKEELLRAVAAPFVSQHIPFSSHSKAAQQSSKTYTMDVTAKQTLVGTVGQTAMLQVRGGTYAIEAGPQMDALGLICLSVFVDDVREKDRAQTT